MTQAPQPPLRRWLETAGFRTTDFAAAARALAGLSVVALLAAVVAATGFALRWTLPLGTSALGTFSALRTSPLGLSALRAWLSPPSLRLVRRGLLAWRGFRPSAGGLAACHQNPPLIHGPCAGNSENGGRCRPFFKSPAKPQNRPSGADRASVVASAGPKQHLNKQHIACRVITHENSKAFHRKTNHPG